MGKSQIKSVGYGKSQIICKNDLNQCLKSQIKSQIISSNHKSFEAQIKSNHKSLIQKRPTF